MRKSYLLHIKLFLIPFILVHCKSESQIQITINLMKIVPLDYDRVEVNVFDGSGFLLKNQVVSIGESLIIPSTLERIKISAFAKNKENYVAEGATPPFTPEKNMKINLLLLPRKSIMFPPIRKFIRPDIWVNGIEIQDAFFIFSEDGKIFKIDYKTWEIIPHSSFSPRENFSLIKSGNSALIVGGKVNGEISDLVEEFSPFYGVTRTIRMRYPRENPKLFRWGKNILVIGGDKNGYCEVLTKDFVAFPCGITENFQAQVVKQTENLIKILIYYEKEGEYEMIYILNENERFKVSYREKIYGIKRFEAQLGKVGGKIFSIGGYDENGEIKECEFLSENDKLEVGGYMNEGIINFSLVSIEPYLIVIGGKDKSGFPNNKIEFISECQTSDSSMTLSFPPKPKNCAFTLFNSYVLLLCKSSTPEIFPVVSVFR